MTLRDVFDLFATPGRKSASVHAPATTEAQAATPTAPPIEPPPAVRMGQDVPTSSVDVAGSVTAEPMEQTPTNGLPPHPSPTPSADPAAAANINTPSINTASINTATVANPGATASEVAAPTAPTPSTSTSTPTSAPASPTAGAASLEPTMSPTPDTSASSSNASGSHAPTQSTTAPLDPNTRATGRPSSVNGASSLHLFWNVPAQPLAEVAVTLEITEPPSDPALVFWALQVSFQQQGATVGAAHLGLQHHSSFPGNGAINWGGYHDRSLGGGQISGSASPLGSTIGNPNTFDFAWEAGRPYRLWIHRSPVQGWRATVFDVPTMREVTVRDLFIEADALTHPMVWTECFADCGAAASAVRWSDPAIRTVAGDDHRPESARVNYQSFADGGCTNSNAFADEVGVVQRTSTDRTTAHSSVIAFP